MRFLRFLSLFLAVIFVLPTMVHAGIWMTRDKPASWRQADWSSAGLLPPASSSPEAAVYVLAARTGRWKGAFAVHSWIVTKTAGAESYNRYDVVGWGTPVRKNAYDADGRWYSNLPEIHFAANGEKAAELIPEIEKAIAAYRWRKNGDYTIWPGPNSNTFVASIVRAVPGFDAEMPGSASGRDYPADGSWFTPPRNGHGLRLSLGGYAGLVLGGIEGVEINFLTMVAGFNPFTGVVKVPAFGTFRLFG